VGIFHRNPYHSPVTRLGFFLYEHHLDKKSIRSENRKGALSSALLRAKRSLEVTAVATSNVLLPSTRWRGWFRSAAILKLYIRPVNDTSMKSRQYLLKLQGDTNQEKLLASWRQHRFYQSALVMGIDIGLEGIGVYLRQGEQELFARTLDLSGVLPEKSDALANRRQMKHARRCRHNRRIRMRRLDELLEKHGLPLQWRDAPEAFRKTDPYKVRYRAIKADGTGLESKFALANAIRHCVQHRGYDYGRFREEGNYPWGDKTKLSAAIAWLKTASLDERTAEDLREMARNLELEVKEADADQKWNEFNALINERAAYAQEHDIERVLAEHARGDKHDNLRTRARGIAFPRSQVWEHLEFIVQHHAHLIEDAEGFLAALGCNPDDRDEFPDIVASSAAKGRTIFWYNRKTRHEMERHWAKKSKDCPYAERLGFGDTKKTSARGELSLRLWAMLEFGITRRVEITFQDAERIQAMKERGEKVPSRKPAKELIHSLSSDAVSKLLSIINAQHGSGGVLVPLSNERRSEIKKEARAIIEQDIIENSGVAAALGPKPAGLKDGKEERWNASFFDQLNDLVAPAPSTLKGTGSLYHETARRLYDVATAGGKDFTREGFNKRLVDLGFYDWRRESVLDWGVFPQVEFLLGRRVKKGKRRGEISESCQGFLRNLLRDLVKAEKLPAGTLAPEFCVVEVVGNAPRTQEQKGKILKEQKANRSVREEQFIKAGREDSGVASRRRRISLYAQQKGRSPYTGRLLPADPFSAELEIEHMFPEAMGGLSVDDNLVLTYKSENHDPHTGKGKGDRTPLQWLGAEKLAQMIAANKDMKWGGLKREVLAWGTRREDDPSGKWPSHYDETGKLLIPDFGNTTRVAQLARQLRAAVAHWLGIEKNAEAMAERIGTPSGWLASQAMKSWLPDYRKDRDDITHHLIDAAVLAHIPPREGMNSIHCGGIFYSERVWLPDEKKPGEQTSRLVTRALSGLSPAQRLAKWLPGERKEYTECPVLKHRPSKNKQSIGDATFWRQAEATKPALAQRPQKPFNAEDYKGDADKLLTELRLMKINERKHRQWCERNKRKGLPEPQFRDVLPTYKDIKTYLERATAAIKAERGRTTEPLRLRDGKGGSKGTPITKIWKWSKKRNLDSPLGLSGKPRTENGEVVFEGLRFLKESNDRMELWLGYDREIASKARKAKTADWEAEGWKYYRRFVPHPTALRHLKQLGFAFDRDKRVKAPPYMQVKPDKPETHVSLRELLLGDELPPFARKVGQFRKGDVLLIGLNQDGGLAGRDEGIAWSAHYTVTAIGTQIEMKPSLFKDKAATPMREIKRKNIDQQPADAAVLASLLDLPSAADHAAELMATNSKVRIPPEPPVKEKSKSNDPPSDTPRGRGGRATPAGEVDLL
jgi:hypothetical protein